MSDMSPLTRAIQCVPARRYMQRRDSHEFAAIEPDQCRINQFADFHHLGKRIDIDAGAPHISVRVAAGSTACT